MARERHGYRAKFQESTTIKNVIFLMTKSEIILSIFNKGKNLW